MHENRKTKGIVLLIDDEEDLLESCARILEDEGYECVTTTDSRNALELARRVRPWVVVTDYKMPGKNGVEILNEINGEFPDAPVVMISAYATTEGVVHAVKMGAFDYLTKPFSSDQLVVTIRRAFTQYRLKIENAALKIKLRNDFFNHYFVGKHPKFLGIVDLIKKVADTESNILIHGETGTGKELAARAIHIHSARSEHPFLVVDSKTLTKEMLEASPRGDTDDSSSHAHKSVLEATHGGTLYLEKVEELDMGLQGRLLKILQDKKTQRRGEWDWVPIDVRIIASTTSDLHVATARQEFRENLYYFLNVVNIRIPSLRERKEDIGILCDIFLKRVAEKQNTPPKSIHHDTLAKLMEYEWPGNVRELRSVIEMTASVTMGQTLMVKDIPEHVRQASLISGLAFKEVKEKWLKRFEKQYLENLLLATNGNISKASEEAGIARMSLYRMIKRNDLTRLATHERSTRGDHPSDKGPKGQWR